MANRNSTNNPHISTNCKSNIVSFQIPKNANPFRVIDGFKLDGQLWVSQYFLLSALWLEVIPKRHIRKGDRQDFKHHGKIRSYIKEEVFWRIQWFDFDGIQSPHLERLMDIFLTHGKGEVALPLSQRRILEKALREEEI